MTLSLAIDAYEKRFVAVTDIDGAYLHAHMDEFVLMIFEGEMAKNVGQSQPTIQTIFTRHAKRKEAPLCSPKTGPIWLHSKRDVMVKNALGVSHCRRVQTKPVRLLRCKQNPALRQTDHYMLVCR